MPSIAAGAGDPRFYPPSRSFAVAEIAEAIGAEASFDDGRRISGVAPLIRAGAGDLSFIDNARYGTALAATHAGAVVVAAKFASLVPAGSVALVVAEPYRGFALAAAAIYPEVAVAPGVHPTAAVDLRARVDVSVSIGAFAVIETGADVGAGTVIGAHAVVGAGVVIGADCRIGAHVCLSHALIGDRVRLHPGARVGQEGFGFVSSSLPFLRVPQLGRVVIEDDVEIGANVTIDRGSAEDTVIGAGSRLDNLVHIAHNVRLGRNCVIVAQVGIAGSTELEDFVVVAGQAGITGHVKVGRGARIGAQAGLMSDVPAGAEMLGSPAEPIKSFWRRIAMQRRAARGNRKARAEVETSTEED